VAKRVKTKISLQKVAVEQDGYHVMCSAIANGQPINLLIDTGASRTVFDNESMERILGIDISGLENNQQLSAGIGTTNLESRFLQLQHLTLGDLSIQNYQSVLIDMSQVNMLYRSLGLPAIEGILGGDLLMELKAVIDYKKMEMTLYKPAKRKSTYTVLSV
jgi:predicted aspartyl protease